MSFSACAVPWSLVSTSYSDPYFVVTTLYDIHVLYMYIVPTVHFQLTVLRGTVLEESIPSSSKMGTNKGIPPRDVVDYITQGEIPLSVLKQRKNNKKVQ